MPVVTRLRAMEQSLGNVWGPLQEAFEGVQDFLAWAPHLPQMQEKLEQLVTDSTAQKSQLQFVHNWFENVQAWKIPIAENVQQVMTEIPQMQSILGKHQNVMDGLEKQNVHLQGHYEKQFQTLQKRMDEICANVENLQQNSHPGTGEVISQVEGAMHALGGDLHSQKTQLGALRAAVGAEIQGHSQRLEESATATGNLQLQLQTITQHVHVLENALAEKMPSPRNRGKPFMR